MGEETAIGDRTAAGSESSSLSPFFSLSSACPGSSLSVSAVRANSPACVVSSASDAACGGGAAAAAAAEEEDDEEDAEGSDDMRRTRKNVGRTAQKKKAGALLRPAVQHTNITLTYEPKNRHSFPRLSCAVRFPQPAPPVPRIPPRVKVAQQEQRAPTAQSVSSTCTHAHRPPMCSRPPPSGLSGCAGEEAELAAEALA
jgi:hypothetical protein